MADRALGAHVTDCFSETLLIQFCAAARRRPVWSLLPEREITTEYGDTRFEKRISESDEEGCLAV
jgi:hypothetical protein